MNLSDLAALIRASPDPGRLLGVYHALNVDRFGPFPAGWYRKEYEWLKAHPMGKSPQEN